MRPSLPLRVKIRFALPLRKPRMPRSWVRARRSDPEGYARHSGQPSIPATTTLAPGTVNDAATTPKEAAADRDARKLIAGDAVEFF